MISKMPQRFGGLLERHFIVVLIVLGAIGLSLFAIFEFVSTWEIGVATGLVLFLTTTILFILGYTFGIVALGFIGIFLLTWIWNRKKQVAKSN